MATPTAPIKGETTMSHCRIHAEETGELRRATMYDDAHGPICRDCAADLGAARANDRYTDRMEAYALGEES
jgi:hypothetical protein